MDTSILLYVFVGFFAQMIDGAMGMAYGVSSNTFLLSIGVPPAAASASVHMAEVVTTGVSGFSHWRLGNINWPLVRRLLIPGVLGGMSGAYLLTSIDGNIIKPYIAAYLLIMGVVILIKAFNGVKENPEHSQRVGLLGLVGGFFDSIGGGGWGPIVTTTLVARGDNPRFTIGSVNFAEFFVTFSESVVFVATLNFFSYWKIILGLLIGGVIAAPLAAIVARKLPVRALMLMVGALIILLSIRTIFLALV
ncbi:MAG TPA: sulfite exporter TauE/SafE family protein [Anaerolineales bacterium]|nr:sulfite exporter TauE/SafE family protein [Anaerolineales bacterium]